MVKVLIMSIALASSTFVWGQEVLQNGVRETFHSKILDENREIYIHLPKSYHDNLIQPAKYPVIYLLDGETNFDYYAGMVDLLSKQPYAEIPEMIVVGIINTDRTKDLTTSVSNEKSTKNPNELVYKTSGGSEKFYNFLETEVKDLLHTKYRTNGYQILVGHSYGGLFATDILFNHSKSYQSYVINDPSLWWNQQKPMATIRDYFKNNSKLPNSTFVYLAQANDEGRSQQTIEEMSHNIVRFKEILEKNHGLYFKHKLYTEEGHGNVIYPANFDALRYIFKGYATNVKEFSADPEKLMSSYEAFSKKQNFTFQPSEIYLNFIIKYLQKNQSTEAENYFKQLKAKLYHH